MFMYRGSVCAQSVGCSCNGSDAVLRAPVLRGQHVLYILCAQAFEKAEDGVACVQERLMQHLLHRATLQEDVSEFASKSKNGSPSPATYAGMSTLEITEVRHSIYATLERFGYRNRLL